MTHQEWIHRVLEHSSQVAVPYNLPLSPVARQRLEAFYRTDDVEESLDLPIRMAGPVSVKPLYASPEKFGATIRDEFGVVWTTNRIDRGVPVGPCLVEPKLAGYTFPDPTAEYRFEPLGPWCRKHGGHFTVIWVGDLWERATFMCGMERLLSWVALEPAFVNSLLDRLTENILRTMDILFDRFAFDCIALSDDYGMQRSLLISPDAWRKLVKPHLAAIFAAGKAAGKTVLLHSCGNVRAVIPDLVELGLDVLHPIQPEAMDIGELKREFGRELTFCGGLPTQNLLIHASPQAVRDEVRRLKDEMGAGGGYILEPGITIQADVPVENIVAIIEAAGT